MRAKKVIFTLVLSLFVIVLFVFLYGNNVFDKIGFRSNSLLANGNFKKGLDNWSGDFRYVLCETGKFVKIIGKNKIGRGRLEQSIQVVSGAYLKISFEFKSEKAGAAVVYKNGENSKLKYFMLGNTSNKWVNYTYEIRATHNGQDYINLVGKEKEDVFFKDIFVLKKAEEITKKPFTIIIIPLLFAIVLIGAALLFVKKPDLFFAIIILSLLMLPISYIDNNEKSLIENRKLAVYKKIIVNGVFNTNFSHDFNEWINDHFFIREFILQNNTLMKSLINRRWENKSVIAGKNKWYFHHATIKNILNQSNKINEKKFNSILNNLKSFDSFCKNVNADLYIVFCPYAEEIYHSQLIGVDISKHVNEIAKIIEDIKNNSEIKCFSAFETLKEGSKKGLVFLKVDHHWSKFGAYKTYLSLMDYINEYHPDICIPNESDYCLNEGNDDSLKMTYEQLNLPKIAYKFAYPIGTKYLIPNYRYSSNIVVNDETHFENNNKIEIGHIKNNFGNGKKIFVFGDSFTRYIKDYISYAFSDTHYWIKPELLNIYYAEQLISDIKPDIVVYINFEQNFLGISKWYKNN